VTRARLVTAVLFAAATVLAACTKSTQTTTIDTTQTQTVISTRPATTPAFKPAPVTTVDPLPPGAAPAKGEVERPCPYILSSQDQGPVSMADLEGDRVYRTTVLTNLKPVGCRFYFWAGPFEAIAEIAPRTVASPEAARAAMIATAAVDPSAEGFHNLVPGVDAISYRTRFFGPDGKGDWACVFVKGKVLVVVRTQRTDTSFNGREIVQAIAAKF
jgi:hypothetical protein